MHSLTKDFIQGNMRLLAMVNELSESLIVVDREGRIRYANPQFTKMTGYELDQLIGSFGQEFLPKGCWPLHNTAPGEGSKSDEMRLACKDGSRFWVTVSSTPYSNKEDKEVGTLITFTSINERKQMEENVKLFLRGP